MTPIPARFDLMRCTGLVLIMAENHAPRENGAGDDHTASISSDVRVHRAALLTAELAEICAKNMFTVRAEGPHATEAPTLAGRPTPEEIIIA